MKRLTIESLCKEAAVFARQESETTKASLYGVTDGKAIGTYLEHKFKAYLKSRYSFAEGNSASGIDFPGLLVDLKVTSIRQPQSSSPFKAARQKVYGLGYSLLLFVYNKSDDEQTRAAQLNILHVIFTEAHRTADFQVTRGLRHILENEGNKDDIMAFLLDRNLPADEIEMNRLAEEVLHKPPVQGFLTISNALQWRLQYGRVIECAGNEEGIKSVFQGR